MLSENAKIKILSQFMVMMSVN